MHSLDRHFDPYTADNAKERRRSRGEAAHWERVPPPASESAASRHASNYGQKCTKKLREINSVVVSFAQSPDLRCEVVRLSWQRKRAAPRATGCAPR